MKRGKAFLVAAACISIGGVVWAQASPAWVPPEPLTGGVIPTTHSDRPARDDWSQAKPVEVLRRTTKARACSASRLREYVKVKCPFNVAGIRQFAGETDDVQLFVTPKTDNVFAPPFGGAVVFPVRKESGYLFQFFEITEGYEGFGVAESVWVDVSWSASRESPTVVIR